MSLIHEALQKARDEAAEQDARQRSKRSAGGRAAAKSSRLGVGLLLGVALGALVAVATVRLLWRPAGESSTPTAEHRGQVAESSVTAMEAVANPSTSTAERAATPGPQIPGIQTPDIPEPKTQDSRIQRPETQDPGVQDPGILDSTRQGLRDRPPADRTATDGSVLGSPSTASGTEPSPAQEGTRRQTVDKPASAPAPGPTRIEPRPAGGQDDMQPSTTTDDPPSEASDPTLPRLIQPPESVGRQGKTNVFVLEADLGDTRVVLDFIVWSASSPFAQINGKQVEVGQLVSGLLVEKIERDRVTLRSVDGRIVLRVR